MQLRYQTRPPRPRPLAVAPDGRAFSKQLQKSKQVKPIGRLRLEPSIPLKADRREDQAASPSTVGPRSPAPRHCFPYFRHRVQPLRFNRAGRQPVPGYKTSKQSRALAARRASGGRLLASTVLFHFRNKRETLLETRGYRGISGPQVRQGVITQRRTQGRGRTQARHVDRFARDARGGSPLGDPAR